MTISVEALGLSEADLQYIHLRLLGMELVSVTSATAFDEELATLRAKEVGGGVTDKAVMPGLKTDNAMSLRGTVLEEEATTERFGRGQNIPQLLDEGVFTVGVGGGVEGRNAVLKAKPMIIDITANLTKRGKW